MQAISIAADGTRTPMGAPFQENRPAGEYVPSTLGCFASLAAPAPDWSEDISALAFYDCTSGAPVGGIGAPSTESFDFNCQAESLGSLDADIIVVPGQP